MAQCATPVIYPQDTLHQSPFNVTLTTLTQDALIYYTLDGSAPIIQQQSGGEAPPDGTTSTASVLGTTYNTVVLNGKEWFAENLAYKTESIGRWWNDAEVKDSAGAYYNPTELLEVNALLASGWRFPTVADFNALKALATNSVGAGNERTWIAQAPFSLVPTGYRIFYPAVPNTYDDHWRWEGRYFELGNTTVPNYALLHGIDSSAVWYFMYCDMYGNEVFVTSNAPDGRLFEATAPSFCTRLVRDFQGTSSYSIAPTAHLYTGPFEVSSSSNVRAAAVSDALQPSLDSAINYIVTLAATVTSKLRILDFSFGVGI